VRESGRKNRKDAIKTAALAALVLALVSTFIGVRAYKARTTPKPVALSEFENRLDAGEVDEVKIYERDGRADVRFTDESKASVYFPKEYTSELVTKIRGKPDVALEVSTQKDPYWKTLLLNVVQIVLPVGLIGLLLWFLLSGPAGGGLGSRNPFSKVRARQKKGESPDVTFADVAGLDEAVEELKEVSEFLERPDRFRSLGAKVPKGILLYGPPGTGKTLLAKAVAGEARAPFFSISGSDFVELFVGVGASRIRSLFQQAKKESPSIVFIDEIDAVGRHRGSGLGGGHDEREQTLNQLLVEMDGFDTDEAVILIAATNRPDILDPALLRPGRFDRQIAVDRPDLKGRVAILEVHTRGKPLEPDVDLDVLARRTPGFTGADLANLVNEAAMLAARAGKKSIGQAELDEAVERVLAGPEKKSRVLTEDVKRRIAVHESGHAIVGHFLPNSHPIHKISIIPRGRTLGYTISLPEADRYILTRNELLDELATLLGGRAAEELILGDVSTGAQDDIEKATALARQMVGEFGMSDSIGPLFVGPKANEVFLGKELATPAGHSESVAAEVDREVRTLVNTALSKARSIIQSNLEKIDRMVEELLDKETLDSDELDVILETPTAEATKGALLDDSPR
jgi:cell division protease FtsH